MKTFRLILLSAFCFLLSGVSWAQFHPFAEVWNNFAYYDTNLERKSFSSLIARYEGKFGIHLFDSPLQVYGAYYGTSSQDPNHWNNVVYAGGGARFRPFEQYQGKGWYDEWLRDLKIFAESLSSTYFKDIASGEANKRTDLRYGFDLWHEWNLDNADERLPWAETWAHTSFRSTNFSWTDFNDYIFYFQPKLGWHLGRGVEFYLRADLTTSGKDYYWLNMADYGAGVRFEPWRKSKVNPLLQKLKMFVEALGVTYLKSKPTNANQNVSLDVRFGIDFSYGRSLE